MYTSSLKIQKTPAEKVANYPFGKFLKDVLHFLKPYKGRFLLASIIRLAGDIASLYPVYALASMINYMTHYTAGQSLAPIWIQVALWVLTYCMRVASQFFCKYIAFGVSERVALDTLYNGVSHLLLLDMAWHEKENSGNKLKRIQNGSAALDKVLRIWISNLIEIGVRFVGTILIVSWFDHTVAAFMLVFMAVHFSCSFFLTRRAGRAAYLVAMEEEKATGLLYEAVGNIRSVKAMAMGPSLKGIITKAIDNLYSVIKLRIFRFQIRGTILSSLALFFKLGVLIIGVNAVVAGQYEVGFLLLFNGYFNDIVSSISELSDASQDIVVARYNIARMNETLHEPITIDSEDHKVAFPRDWKVISIQNVSFSYGTNKVLSDISFDIHRGKRIGIVGLSGAGKSTLFKLLLKEYESSKGDIFVDGVSLRDISKLDYFKYVSVVLQDTEVFNFSLKQNIVLGNAKKASDTALLNRSMKIAHVTDFLKKLPQGVDALIGERGIKLSGGEKQRLGIARAVFKEPQLLLLDEATSHLDLESEEKIKESLHEFFDQVTAVVIAHRLTTIREMDTIILFEDSKIAEMGNFDELYKKKGRFYDLWERQKL